MKRFVLYLASFLVVGGLFVHPQAALAQTDALSSEALVNLRTNCGAIKTTINRIHTNDALVRVNVGQNYNAISTRLMAKLNSRLSLNKLNASKLVSATNEFESARQQFSSDYNSYDTTMSDLDKINCHDDPAKYHQKLVEARVGRQQLARDITTLNKLIVSYRDEVLAVKASLGDGNG